MKADDQQNSNSPKTINVRSIRRMEIHSDFPKQSEYLDAALSLRHFKWLGEIFCPTHSRDVAMGHFIKHFTAY
jgi:hypothetical protein